MAAYEKAVVSWRADSEVDVCPGCSKRFILTRRRHHCRLCGGIMCHKCSQFLPLEYASESPLDCRTRTPIWICCQNLTIFFLHNCIAQIRRDHLFYFSYAFDVYPVTVFVHVRKAGYQIAGKLTNPAFSYDGQGFRRTNSNSSLNSMFGADGDQHIRTCTECRQLLERRDQQMEQRNTTPHIVQLYNVNEWVCSFIWYFFSIMSYSLHVTQIHIYYDVVCYGF